MRLVVTILIGLAGIASVLAPPAKLFADPELARLIFIHLPCAFTCSLLLPFGSYLGFRTALSKGSRVLNWDARARVANEIGFAFALVTMATGILFSKVQWGAWWQWDPRQTSFLFVLLIYGAYFALRAAYSDDTMRAKASGAYAAIAVVPTVFLIFVFPRMKHIVSFHPTNTVIEGKFDRVYWSVILFNWILFLILAVALYRYAVKKGLNYNESIDTDPGDSAPPPVVRAVDVPSER